MRKSLQVQYSTAPSLFPCIHTDILQLSPCSLALVPMYGFATDAASALLLFHATTVIPKSSYYMC